MNYDKIKFNRDYLGGMSFTTHSSRKYKYTIAECENKQMIDKEFFAETHTPRDPDGFYLDGKTTYYINAKSKIYKSIKWLLKSL